MTHQTHETLSDLLGHWERGELTLEEVLARWPHDGVPNEELLRELLRMIMRQARRLRVLEMKVG